MSTTAGSGARAPGARRMTRPRDCAVSGVSEGLAEHLGWSVAGVRWAFALSNLAGGAGILLYLWLWALTPLRTPEGRDSASAEAPVQRRVPVPTLLVDLAAALAVLSFVAILLTGSTSILALTVPLVIALALGSIAWSRYVDVPLDPEAIRTAFLQRVGVGCGLVVLAFLVALISLQPGAGWLWLLVVVTAASAAAVAIGPEALTLRRQTAARRTEQVRDEQRAEMAAHLHDSVLQTLALIQNRAGASSEVARIARAQERELRDWLYAGAQAVERDLAADLRDFAAALELDYPVRIEVVVVGETSELGTGEVAAAARESMLNAARHAGGDVSVYLESAARSVDVFVRDRGAGFALDDVPEDRLGVRESIMGRMRRAGGAARVRPGAGGIGTEVHLHLERSEDE
ncbi:ATP-binding protein [Frondihabitans sucicola]|uniref:ATP-binding protein n=1 Tax=Frondihabitans sucicola TaxID=1268041 RepID=UPI0025726B09|nr:ATP-binding protein [Frondihabitans sucicola]